MRTPLRSLPEVEKERKPSLCLNRFFLILRNNSYKFDSVIYLGGNVDMAIWRPIGGSLPAKGKASTHHLHAFHKILNSSNPRLCVNLLSPLPYA